jgi:hypothetical protein
MLFLGLSLSYYSNRNVHLAHGLLCCGTHLVLDLSNDCIDRWERHRADEMLQRSAPRRGDVFGQREMALSAGS